MRDMVSGRGVVAAPRLVVIAASAGGVPALSQLVADLPTDFPAAVAIVLHRSPTRPSVLAAILGRRTRLPVVEITTPGVRVDGGQVYLAPADRHLVVTADRRFALMDGRRIRHVRSSANPLFESAAAVFGEGVVAVVLTGGDSDGTDGVQSVRRHGGHVIAQDPETAACSGMPQAAVDSGAVDEILPLDAIAARLVALVGRRGVPVAASD